MDYRQARKLHNEDEVTIKATGQIVSVINTEDHPKEKFVLVYAIGEQGYTAFNHTEIE